MLLQIAPVQIVGGFLLMTVLSTLLANTAAYFVTGTTQLVRSLLPGTAVALVGLIGWSLTPATPTGAAITVAAALVVDLAAVTVAYGLSRRGTAMVTAVHYALIVAVGFLVQSSLALYQTAPG